MSRRKFIALNVSIRKLRFQINFPAFHHKTKKEENIKPRAIRKKAIIKTKLETVK